MKTRKVSALARVLVAVALVGLITTVPSNSFAQGCKFVPLSKGGGFCQAQSSTGICSPAIDGGETGRCQPLNDNECECKGGIIIWPPLPGYDVKATPLTPASIEAGNTASSTVSVTSVNGLSGTVTLSCNGITGSNPAPGCEFETNPVSVAPGSPATSTLTVETSGSAKGSYTIPVTGSDNSHQPPKNGAQSLTLKVAHDHGGGSISLIGLAGLLGFWSMAQTRGNRKVVLS